MKICLICSPGGHLIESLKLLDAFKFNELFLITYDENFDFSTINQINKIYSITNLLIKRVDKLKILKYIYLVISMVFLTITELKIILKENPDIIVSTGSEIAIPSFYIAQILQIKTIFIESLTRINELSGTGRIVYPVSDVFLVQWEDLARKYKKSVYRGSILGSIKCTNRNKGDFIFVTVGTASFKRLVRAMDELSEYLSEKIIIQIGRTDYKPKNVEYFKFTKDIEEFSELCKNAKVIVSHAGVGNVINALEDNTPLIIVPRREEYKEHIDNHQIELAKSLENFSLINVAYEEGELLNAIKKIDFPKPNENKLLFFDKGEFSLFIYLKDILKTWSGEKSEI